MLGSVRRIAAESFRAAGGIGMVRWLHRRSLRILMYHRFASSADLERQCAHLRTHYVPVSLSQVADARNGGAPLPERAIAVTVDDGYRDFHDIAFPVFARHEIPATIFVVSRFLDGDYWLWGDRVKYCFRHTPLERVRLELPRGCVVAYSLSDDTSRARAASNLKERAKRMPSSDCEALVEGLPAALKVEMPPRPPGEFAPMTWDEARRVAAGGMEVGAHTVTHPILSGLASRQELDAEIAGSRDRIQECLDRPVRHFCYPNGRMRDIGPALAAVRQAGFDTAVTTETGINGADADLHLLRRIGVETSYREQYFEQCAAAFRV
jgi:peptidoglycan/xylan/chitin deacetylase (PgdA/CDA1 family)